MLASGYTCACLRARRSPRGQDCLSACMPTSSSASVGSPALACQRAGMSGSPFCKPSCIPSRDCWQACLPACVNACVQACMPVSPCRRQAGQAGRHSGDRHIRRQACQQMRRQAREQAGGLARERGGRFACLPARSPACGQACLAVVHGQTCLPAHQLPCLQAGMPAFLHAVVRVARSCWQACLPA